LPRPGSVACARPGRYRLREGSMAHAAFCQGVQSSAECARRETVRCDRPDPKPVQRTACAAGFLILSQCADRPAWYGVPSRLETMRAQPSSSRTWLPKPTSVRQHNARLACAVVNGNLQRRAPFSIWEVLSRRSSASLSLWLWSIS
jgi:hypothetical protein